MPELDSFLSLAIDLAEAAGAVIRPYFRQPIAIDDKPDLSPVTIADRTAEAAMRRLIAARFPEHGIIGEEYGPERAEAEFVWVLDPIDGNNQGWPVVVVALTLETVTDAPFNVRFTFCERAVPPVCTLKLTGFGVATRVCADAVSR